MKTSTHKPKSQAQKSRGAIPALSQRLQKSFQSGADYAHL
nr:MAG TPA: hypothetical protein [Caudoviricetes sp.]